MRWLVFVLLVSFAGSAWGAPYWVRPARETAPSSTSPRILEVTQADPIAYLLFVPADGTTTSGPNLKTFQCERLEVTLFLGGTTGAVKLYESDAGVNSTVSVTNLPQITSDFDNDGVSDSDALDQTTIEKSGLRNFMADSIVPAVTTACGSGTCKLKVQCAGAQR